MTCITNRIKSIQKQISIWLEKHEIHDTNPQSNKRLDDHWYSTADIAALLPFLVFPSPAPAK